MLARRLLAVLVAVLCIAAWLGVEAGGLRSDEARAFVGPSLVCRISLDVAAEPQDPADPDGFADLPRASGFAARVARYGEWRAAGGRAPARERRGDPKASRGPPSFVVS